MLRRFQHAPEMTLMDLGGDRLRFSHERCISGGRFILHFIIRSFGSTTMTSINESSQFARLHTCIPLKLYHMFPADSVSSIPDDDISSDEDETDELEEVRRQLQTRAERRALESASASTNITLSRPSTPIASAQHLSTNPAPQPNPAPAPLQRDPSLSVLPNTLWQVPFAPAPGRYAGLLGSQPLAEDAYDLATDGNTVPVLRLEGTSVVDLAAKFVKMVGEGVKAKDFTSILSPDRSCEV